MKTGNIEKVERKTILLEMGIDFQANDLEVIAINGINELRGLSKEFRNKFWELGLGSLVFSGHFDKDTKTLIVKTEKELFV